MNKPIQTSEMFNQEIIEKIKHSIEYNDYEAFFYHNADLSKTIYVSPSYEKILNDTRENLYSNPLSFIELIIEDDKLRFMKQYNSYLTTGVFDMQFRIKNIEGNILWIHAITEPVFDNNVLAGHITRARDITKLKEYEIELEEKEKMLSIIIQTQSEMICTYESDTTLTFVNDAYCKFYSSTKEDLLGKRYIDLFEQIDYEQEKEWNSSLTIDKPMRTQEFMRIQSNGKKVWIRWTDHAIFNTDGEQKEIISVGVDITSEKTMLEELKEKEKQLSIIVNTQKEMICSHRPDTTLTFVNKAYSDLLGKDEKTLLGQKYIMFLPKNEREAELNWINSMTIDNPQKIKEYSYTKHSNTIWAKWTDHGIFDANGQLKEVIGVGVDITTEKTLIKEIEKSYKETIQGWAHALSLKDDETECHSERVTQLSLSLARHVGFPQEKLVMFEYGALLHDIGKMGISDSILLKPGKLTDDEFAEIKKHPVYAYDMLSNIEYLRDALDIPYCHHEKWDGTGYPQGLRGDEIPLAARIFAIIDVFDALTSDRPYRKAWTYEKTIDYIKEQSGTHFDPMVVEAFLEFMSLQENES
ncbi:MAG: PAS domain S-box protein [Acholeplasmataceae bacterium]|nr:PAS domain S-box protein [Acholeplasmataceae bacterium]